METHDAVVYDLDGTLVELAVDWEQAAADGRQVFVDHGVEPTGNLWELLETAPDHGLESALEQTLTAHETNGARDARRAVRADDLPLDVPTGVCSLNSEQACRVALTTQGLADHVDCVVGRDSLKQHKPHPEPLLTVVRALGATPHRTLFVGDTRRDEKTAERAGVAFEYAGDGPNEY